jgi:hypothetical protein
MDLDLHRRNIHMMHQSTLFKRVGACVLAGAIITATLPATAYMQGDSPLPTPPTTVPAVPPKPARPMPPVKISTQTFSESGVDPVYIIDVKYPMAPPEGNNNTFNRLSQELVDETVAAFKNDLAANGNFTDTAAFTNSLYIDYAIVRNSKGIISVRFDNSIYFAGAAHPNPFTRVLNFDLTEAGNGQPLELSEVFKPDVDYLTTLSNYCRRVLQRRSRLMFPEGVDPKPENYQNWNMSRNALIITFDVYQVAPYAAGKQQCQVPLAFLRRQLADPRRW